MHRSFFMYRWLTDGTRPWIPDGTPRKPCCFIILRNCDATRRSGAPPCHRMGIRIQVDRGPPRERLARRGAPLSVALLDWNSGTPREENPHGSSARDWSYGETGREATPSRRLLRPGPYQPATGSTTGGVRPPPRRHGGAPAGPVRKHKTAGHKQSPQAGNVTFWFESTGGGSRIPPLSRRERYGTDAHWCSGRRSATEPASFCSRRSRTQRKARICGNACTQAVQ